MPFLTYTAADYALLYDLDAEPYADTGFRPHARLGYHRAVLLNTMFEDRAVNVPRVLGWTTSTRVCVLGAGYGWFLERMAAHGYTNLVAADISTWIQANKSLTEETDINAAIVAVGLNPLTGDGAALKTKLFDGGTRARGTILNEDCKTNLSRNRVKTALGGTVNVVYTENVLEALTDSEVTALVIELRKLAPVAHLITTLSDGSTPGLLNWKTGPAWATLVAPDKVIEDGTYSVYQQP